MQCVEQKSDIGEGGIRDLSDFEKMDPPEVLEIDEFVTEVTEQHVQQAWGYVSEAR